VVGHITPEAFKGGVLAVVEDAIFWFIIYSSVT
jgi:hypothetical protein